MYVCGTLKKPPMINYVVPRYIGHRFAHSAEGKPRQIQSSAEGKSRIKRFTLFARGRKMKADLKSAESNTNLIVPHNRYLQKVKEFYFLFARGREMKQNRNSTEALRKLLHLQI